MKGAACAGGPRARVPLLTTCGLLALAGCGDAVDDPGAADPSTADLLLAIVDEVVERAPEGRRLLAYTTYVVVPDPGTIPEEVQRALCDAGVEIIHEWLPFGRDTTATILGFVPPRPGDGYHWVGGIWWLPYGATGASSWDHAFAVTCSDGRCRAEHLGRGHSSYGMGPATGYQVPPGACRALYSCAEDERSCAPASMAPPSGAR